MARDEREGEKAARGKKVPGAKSESLDSQSCEIEGGVKSNGSQRTRCRRSESKLQGGQGCGRSKSKLQGGHGAGDLRVSSKEDKVWEV